MTPQSSYEKARDEAADSHAFNGNYSNNNDEAGNAFAAFKAGSDWYRDYSQNINADLLADCKAMKLALQYYQTRDELCERYAEQYPCLVDSKIEHSEGLTDEIYDDYMELSNDYGTTAAVCLLQLKGKYDE